MAPKSPESSSVLSSIPRPFGTEASRDRRCRSTAPCRRFEELGDDHRIDLAGQDVAADMHLLAIALDAMVRRVARSVRLITVDLLGVRYRSR